MNETIFSFGKWICSEPFSKLSPLDILHKEHDKHLIELPLNLKNNHIIIRKTFTVKELTGDYKIRITADDYYKLYINGKFVGQGPAQGYYYDYYWNEFDITAFLSSGENIISVSVYYCGLINRAYNSGDRRMGMIAEVYSNQGCVLFTDSDWEYAEETAYKSHHIIGYDTQFSEDYDSRETPGNFKACFVKETDYTFSRYPAKALQVYEIEPISEENLPGGGKLYDFGSEVTGTLCIRATGKSGDRVRILCGEELEDTSVKVRYNMRCNCLYEEYWTLSEGECMLDQYDYKAYRYAAIIPEKDAVIKSVTTKVRHYPFDDSYCNLETDNRILKSVWDICKNSVRYGAQEVFVDCPSREKGQYLGDLTITSDAHMVLTGDISLLEKSIDNMAASSRICRGIMAVAPGSLMQEIADYSLQFPIIALRHYKYSADKNFLRKNLEICENILEHFKGFAREDGLLENVTDKWNLVDWPVNLRDGYDFPITNPIGRGCHNVINAFYIGCVLGTEEIRKILSAENEKRSDKLIASFERAFFDKKTGLYTDSEGGEHSAVHSNILPVYYGFYNKNSGKAIGDFLVEKGLCCGVYMAYFLLKALCRLGRYTDAYSLITSEGENSWYNMVREGATTCFEAWGKDKKANTSLCHPWASGPIPVLADDILPNIPGIGKLLYSDPSRSEN